MTQPTTNIIPHEDPKSLADYRRNFRAAQAEIRSFFKDVRGGNTNDYARLPSMVNRARDILGKYGFGLRFGMAEETKQVQTPRGQTVMGRFYVAAIPDEPVALDDAYEFQASGWFDLFGTADSYVREGVTKYTMTPIKENGSALTYAFRYLLSAMSACPMDSEDPEKYQGEPQGNQQDNARAAAAAQGGYKQPPASGGNPETNGKVVSGENQNKALDAIVAAIKQKVADGEQSPDLAFFTAPGEWQGKPTKPFIEQYDRRGSPEPRKYMPSLKKWLLMCRKMQAVGFAQGWIDKAYQMYHDSGGNEAL